MRYLPLLLLLACGPPPGPVPPTPVVVDTDLCDAAGQNLLTACPKLAKTPAGKPFADFCREAHSDGLFVNPACVSKAKSCDEANVCSERQ